MSPLTHALTFSGELLRRGFWLYIWEITTPEQTCLYYVGRTGDSSSIKAQSPFNRMGQHLSSNPYQNMLRRHLEGALRGVDPERCAFRLVAHGPILEETTLREEHRERRDRIAAMEKALAAAMRAAGYEVMNTVKCRTKVDAHEFAAVRVAFAADFPNLNGGIVG